MALCRTGHATAGRVDAVADDAEPPDAAGGSEHDELPSPQLHGAHLPDLCLNTSDHSYLKCACRALMTLKRWLSSVRKRCLGYTYIYMENRANGLRPSL